MYRDKHHATTTSEKQAVVEAWKDAWQDEQAEIVNCEADMALDAFWDSLEHLKRNRTNANAKAAVSRARAALGKIDWNGVTEPGLLRDRDRLNNDADALLHSIEERERGWKLLSRTAAALRRMIAGHPDYIAGKGICKSGAGADL